MLEQDIKELENVSWDCVARQYIDYGCAKNRSTSYFWETAQKYKKNMFGKLTKEKWSDEKIKFFW